jgi:hypothetical protein
VGGREVGVGVAIAVGAGIVPKVMRTGDVGLAVVRLEDKVVSALGQVIVRLFVAVKNVVIEEGLAVEAL